MLNQLPLLSPAPLFVPEIPLPRNITRVDSPICLPHGWYEAIPLPSLEAAIEEANGRTSYLHKSNILTTYYYLFVPTEES